jgi:putative ABC transport system permease protein
MSALWAKIIPNESFNFEYLSQYVQNAYESEQHFSRLFLWFSGLAIFIACLGLLGLAAYSAAQRSHEIAIRKVLGAGVDKILKKLVTDFTKWILMACLIAWPAGWIIMHRWLEGFAYRISLTPWPFVTAACIALVIGMATVAFHAIRAANRDPVQGIKYE